MLEGEKKNEAWVRIVGLPISLWDRDTLRKVRPIMRVLPVARRGKNNGVEGEVEGDVSARAGKRVLEEVDNARIETHLQSADGTRGADRWAGAPLARFRGLVGSLVGDPGRPTRGAH
ncbi:hypothetical protein CK203_048015 [Vitis vinifera]|uniref:DUF4283 domain-containing protein n=1 Tax=Vitis vinifera TaxID=29760 RepID=A0A438GH53_VITVI|nr:hypothetical protein CK203_048015 [Vitis vinifera]